MNRSESKYSNTAAKMDRALVTLLDDKPFAEISINDICREAGVNRSTFYAHYGNTYELLKEVHANLIGNFLSECKFDETIDINDMRGLGKDEVNFVSPQYLLPYLRYIRKHRHLFRIYHDNAPAFEVDEIDGYLMENLFVPIYAKHGVTDRRLITYAQKFFLRGIGAIIDEWVRRDCEDDILFICEIIIFSVRPLTYKT